MNNSEIADHFSLLSKLMDIHGENSFKSKTYSITAFNIEKLPKEIELMSDAELFNTKGIGDSTGKKILELLHTGKMPALEKLIADTPPGILDMLQIKGLGPKKIAVIWNELGIESLGELEYACNENRLVSLKGFGEKTQTTVLENIAYFKQNQGFFLMNEALNSANSMLVYLNTHFPNSLVSVTGEMRRQIETIEYIDFITDIENDKLIIQLKTIPECNITESEGFILFQLPFSPKVKFYYSDTHSFYKNLFLTTGSEAFLTHFLKSYQLPESPKNEEDVFEINQLQYIEPALRENSAILGKAVKKNIPQLITPKDIKGIIHSHSKWSDGMYSIEDMAKAAIEAGLEYLVISDHSQSAGYANGLKPDRIAAQHAEIDLLNTKLAPFKIFKSIESDILSDGGLDYTPTILNTFDLVIASVHSNLKMTQEKAMERVMAAIRNPNTTILGHATGRLLLSRKGYPLDFEKMIDACAEHKVVIEINAHPRRLDLDWRWIEYAINKGVLLSIDPDAHSIDGYKDVLYGCLAAQKGGLTAANNLSSFSLIEIEQFLKENNKKRTI